MAPLPRHDVHSILLHPTSHRPLPAPPNIRGHPSLRIPWREIPSPLDKQEVFFDNTTLSRTTSPPPLPPKYHRGLPRIGQKPSLAISHRPATRTSNKRFHLAASGFHVFPPPRLSLHPHRVTHRTADPEVHLQPSSRYLGARRDIGRSRVSRKLICTGNPRKRNPSPRLILHVYREEQDSPSLSSFFLNTSHLRPPGPLRDSFFHHGGPR